MCRNDSRSVDKLSCSKRLDAKDCLVLAALFVLGASSAHAAQLVTDETVRLRVLHTAFPNARISNSPAATESKQSLPGGANKQEIGFDTLGAISNELTDALEGERRYDVIGSVSKDEETPASDITAPPKNRLSDKRQVRLRLYRWQGRLEVEPVLVAFLNYSFPDAKPAHCCGAVGKLLLTSDAVDRILAHFNKTSFAFTSFTSIRFLDINDDGTEEVLVGEDFGGGASTGVNLAIFDLSHGTFNLKFQVTTAVFSAMEDFEEYVLTLDEQRTVSAKGETFHFVKKTYAANGKAHPKPIVTRISYPAGTGANAKD